MPGSPGSTYRLQKATPCTIFPQILLSGETEFLTEGEIKVCLENVEVLLKMLGCELKLVLNLKRSSVKNLQIDNVDKIESNEDIVVNENC